MQYIYFDPILSNPSSPPIFSQHPRQIPCSFSVSITYENQNTTKQKGKNKQTKEVYKNHGVHFVLASYSWACSQPLSYYTQCLPLKKTDCPSPDRYQMQKASELTMSNGAHFSFSVLGLFLAWTCVPLGHAVTVSEGSDGHQPCCVQKVNSLGVINHLCLLFHIDPWDLRGGNWQGVLFRAEFTRGDSHQLF